MSEPKVAAAGLRPVLLAGLIATACLAVLPLLDLAFLGGVTEHVRRAYPEWSDEYLAGESAVLAGYLVAVGVMGSLGWAWALVRSRRRPIRGAASVLLILGIAVALAHLSVGVAAYDRVIPLTYGLLWTFPIAIGIAAVVLSFRPLPYQEST